MVRPALLNSFCARRKPSQAGYCRVDETSVAFAWDVGFILDVRFHEVMHGNTKYPVLECGQEMKKAEPVREPVQVGDLTQPGTLVRLQDET
jgi:hypothetical protein